MLINYVPVHYAILEQHRDIDVQPHRSGFHRLLLQSQGLTPL